MSEPHGPSIVVVDDAPANLILLSGLLDEAGYDVRVANSAQRALALIERLPPDLVILDVNLPDRDGFSVCRDLKANPALAAIPVVFLSAEDDAAARQRAREAGGAEYLTKPFDSADVLARIAGHLRLGAALRENERLRKEVEELRARLDAATRRPD